MARIKIEDIVDHLESDIRRALDDTIRRNFPNENYNSHQLFREFKRAVGRKCGIWERVPDSCVEED